MFILYDRAVDHPLIIDSFVRDLSIITTAEPVQSTMSATQFETEEDAKVFINRLKESNSYDITACEIIDLEKAFNIEKGIDDERKRNEKANAWARTPEFKRRNILRKILKKDGDTGIKDWLDYVKDTSDIIPLTDDEYIQHKVDEITLRYGITVTDDQRTELRKRFIEGEQTEDTQQTNP